MNAAEARVFVALQRLDDRVAKIVSDAPELAGVQLESLRRLLQNTTTVAPDKATVANTDHETRCDLPAE